MSTQLSGCSNGSGMCVFNALKMLFLSQACKTQDAAGTSGGRVSFEKDGAGAIAEVADPAQTEPEPAHTGLLAMDGNIQRAKGALYLFSESPVLVELPSNPIRERVQGCKGLFAGHFRCRVIVLLLHWIPPTRLSRGNVDPNAC